MRIGIVVVTYGIFPEALFDSAQPHEGDVLSWYIHHHGRDQNVERLLSQFASENGATLHLHKVNRGVSVSWNDGIAASINDGSDITLVCNDDIEFLDGGFQKFVTFLASQEDFGLGFAFGIEGKNSHLAGQVFSQDFACFGISKRIVERIGFFDENFYPAYFEDNDYRYRGELAGIPVTVDERVILKHERSATTRNSLALTARHHKKWQSCERYFLQKWGSLGQGKHKFPFNNSEFNEKISWERRHRPYGEPYDRADLDPLRDALFFDYEYEYDPGESSAKLIPGTMLVHYSQIGDVFCEIGQWPSCPSAEFFIEGIEIFPPSTMRREDVRVTVLFADGGRAPELSGTAFCGTRGLSRPLFAVMLDLVGDAEMNFDVLCENKYAGDLVVSGRDSEKLFGQARKNLIGIRVEFVEKHRADDDVLTG